MKPANENGAQRSSRDDGGSEAPVPSRRTAAPGGRPARAARERPTGIRHRLQTRIRAPRHLGAIVFVVAPLVAVGVPQGTAVAAVTPALSGSWPYPNADLANTRDAPGSSISSANVGTLKEAWTFKITGPAAKGISAYGSLAGTPIVDDGVVYLQDLYANVYALSLQTGSLLWEYHVNSPLSLSLGPDGVAVTGGVVYGDSPSTAFALNAATGKPIWVDRNLLQSNQGPFGIQPQVANGRVYLATALGTGPHGGVLLALSASTGAVVWKFNSVVSTHPGVYAAGGAWETPLVGTDGSVTYGIGNPYQSAESAIEHPSTLAYTDSDVNLNATTGKLRWYYQGVPDDFKDYDMQTSPVAVTIGGKAAVLGAGKMGYVYAMNATTGGLIWKTPVGQHNGHDNDSLQALEHKSTLTVPFTFLPGSLGGVLTDLAVAGGSAYVATVDIPFEFTALSQVAGADVGAPAGAKATGEVEALSLATGKVEWDKKFSQMPLGGATISNDLVFTTLYDGQLVALNRSTGAVVYEHALPTSANSTIAIAGNTVLVPAGGPRTAAGGGSNPQLVAYFVP
jgi:alcohol dehydrogenase (cytochrome c)